jgi:hypothetical protein
MRTLRRDGGRLGPRGRVRSCDKSKFDQSMFPQSRSPFPLLSLTASAYGGMARRLALLGALAVVLSGCGQDQPAATASPTAGCPEPTRTVFGVSPFDDENKAMWKKDLETGATCEVATKSYIERLEKKKEEQLFANASTFAFIGRVTDAISGAPVEQVCVIAGKPGSICWGRTDRDGWYLVDIGAVGGQPGFFEIYFTKSGYPDQHLTSRMLSGRARLDHQMTK